VKYTRLQIVRILKDRGWTKKRSLWFADKGIFGYVAKHLGVSLRDAASFEMLEASDNLDARRKQK
jgi:hypothetical protein